MDIIRIPTVKYTGKLKIGPDLEINVHVLDDGQRVIPEDDMCRALQWLVEGPEPVEVTTFMELLTTLTPVDGHAHNWLSKGFYSICACGWSTCRSGCGSRR